MIKLRSCAQVLAILLSMGPSLAAQDAPAMPNSFGGLVPIPLEDAEQHLVEREPPIYPPIAWATRVEGDVRLTLEVDQTGAVVGITQSSGHPLLIQAAADAAKKYRYRPFEMNGNVAKVFIEAVVTFSRYVPAPHMPFPQVTTSSSVLMQYDNGSVKVSVSGDGLVQYSGDDNRRVVVLGKHTRKIAREEVYELLDTFERSDFYSLREDYSVGATDVGTTTTSIEIDGLRKSIKDDWVGVPAVLKNVQNAILKYSHSEQWIKGNGDTVSGLLAEASDPVSRRRLLSDVLPRAALQSDTAVVQSVLANGVDLNHHGPFGSTALMLAADRGLPEMVAALLKAGANPHAKDREGRGALIFGAGSGNAEVVRLLLAAGLNGDAQDKYGDTALMAAAGSGNPECVSLLLKSGAKVNARNNRHQTALLSGAEGYSGFYVDDYGRYRAEVPEKMIHRDTVVRLLLDAGAWINARNWDGETALFTLEEDAVEELIRHHIDLEMRDKYADTALTRTVSASIAELLIRAGADVNAKGYEGETALIQAAENNYVDKIELLLKAPGIQIDLKDDKGETALMKARANRLNDCVRLLVSAGATQ